MANIGQELALHFAGVLGFAFGRQQQGLELLGCGDIDVDTGDPPDPSRRVTLDERTRLHMPD